jgi:predicted nicotinamide N-methyase
MTTTSPADFIRAHTTLDHHPMVPEITLYLATEITPIWHATEDWLAERNIAPPFWAFAWPGGLALARHILDNPHLAAGKRVLDFAAGGGIAAIACAMVGAASVGAANRWDLILCGDVCYEAPMTAHILPWLEGLAGEVWVADPGRTYLPRTGLEPFARYAVATTLELEDRVQRDVVLYRLLGVR